jgi:hypothetical protein
LQKGIQDEIPLIIDEIRKEIDEGKALTNEICLLTKVGKYQSGRLNTG